MPNKNEAKKTQEKAPSTRKGFILGNYIKLIVFMLVGAAVLTGNFFLENKTVAKDDVETPLFSEFSYEEENYIPNGGVVRFAGDVEYGFPNSILVDSATEDNEYVFNLASTKLWGNFTISDSKVNFVAGRVVIIPDNAAFDLEFDGSRVKLAVYDGDVYVGLLEEGIVVDEYLNQYSELFMNKLLVPRDTQVDVSLKKITSKLKTLLYLKLVKEFKYSAIPSSVRETYWIKDNLAKDAKYDETVEQNVSSEIIFKGKSVSESTMGEFIFWSEENLTFVPEKKSKIVLEHLFASLDDAIYFANEGDETSSELSWTDFVTELGALPADIAQSEELIGIYDSYIDKLSVFGPEDKQYIVLKHLLEKKMFSGREVYDVIGFFWQDVYEGMNISDVAAEEALNQYYGYLDSVVIGGQNDEDFYKDYISYHNQLFDNLFLRYSTFYRDGYFAMKNVLEQELLKLFEDDEELAQELISVKIDFLKRLMKFFFDEEIVVAEAKEVLSRLVEEIDELMPVDGSNVAVIELFETRLEDIGDFWGYLNSPEYHISKTYGATHEERYDTYLEEKDKIWDFINIQEEVLGETVVEITVEELAEAVELLFMENPDVSEVEVGDIAAVDERYISARGVIGGYPFESIYDRDKETLSEVYAYNEMVSDRPVTLENLLSLLQERFADLADVDLGDDEELTVESVAERAARLYIAELIGEYGFEIEMDDVSVVNELDAIYRVLDVKKKDSDTVATFDFMMNGEKVINLYLVVGNEPVVMDGEFSLEELSSIASAEEDFAVEDDGGALLR